MIIIRRCLSILMVLIAPPMWLSSQAQTASDLPTISISAAAQRAVDALQSEDLDELAAVLAEVGNVPDVALFTDYLAGKKLQLQLDALAAEMTITNDLIAAITDYRLRFPDHPFSQMLYRHLLSKLIERQQWVDFMAVYQQDGTDYEACAERRYWLEVKGNSDRALAHFDQFWQKGYLLPKLCDPIVAAWKEHGGGTQEDHVAKFNNAIQHGQIAVAKSVLPSIDEPQRSQLARWVTISVKPDQLIGVYQDWQYPQDDELLRYGLRLLINKDSVRYKSFFDQAYDFRQHPKDSEWMDLCGQLILYLLSRNDASAVTRLFALPTEQWRDTHRDWYIRTLLRADRKEAIAQFLARQPATYHFPSDKIRPPLSAASSTPERQSAKFIINKIYYNKLINNKNIIRSIIFRENNLHRYAIYEWQQAIADLDQEGLVQSIFIAQAHDWPHRMIRVAADKGLWHIQKALYPAPHESTFQQFSVAYSVPRALAYAIAREESLFDEQAKSSAKAIGIMQLTFDSAQAIAKQLNMRISEAALFDKNINIELGIKYLSILLKRFNYKEQAIAAYNAGPSVVATWNPKITDMTVWVSLIPYKETRLYVQRVLATEQRYRELYDF